MCQAARIVHDVVLVPDDSTKPVCEIGHILVDEQGFPRVHLSFGDSDIEMRINEWIDEGRLPRAGGKRSIRMTERYAESTPQQKALCEALRSLSHGAYRLRKHTSASANVPVPLRRALLRT